MAAIFDAQGTSWDFGGVTVNPNTFTMPGWSRQEIDATDHGNSNVTTKVLGSLKDYSQMVVNVPFDSSEHSQISTGNQEVTVTFPDSSTISFWVDVQAIGDLELASNNSEKPSYDVTLTVTNRDSTGSESAPA